MVKTVAPLLFLSAYFYFSLLFLYLAIYIFVFVFFLLGPEFLVAKKDIRSTLAPHLLLSTYSFFSLLFLYLFYLLSLLSVSHFCVLAFPEARLTVASRLSLLPFSINVFL